MLDQHFCDSKLKSGKRINFNSQLLMCQLEYSNTQIPGHYSTWYSTSNKGRLSSYFRIKITGRVICQSLVWTILSMYTNASCVFLQSEKTPSPPFQHALQIPEQQVQVQRRHVLQWGNQTAQFGTRSPWNQNIQTPSLVTDSQFSYVLPKLPV